MLTAMDRVGAAIRKAYHWIPIYQTYYLVIDNDGVHGTNTVIAQYTVLLLDKCKVQLIFQVLRYPYTPTLNLGVWMCLQAFFEREHYLK